MCERCFALPLVTTYTIGLLGSLAESSKSNRDEPLLADSRQTADLSVADRRLFVFVSVGEFRLDTGCDH